MEVFGDMGLILTGDWQGARLQVTRTLRMLDLRGPDAMRAGTTARIAKVTHDASQRWSHHLYEIPAYAACDGLVNFRAHNAAEAVALYERAEVSLDCPPPRCFGSTIPRCTPPPETRRAGGWPLANPVSRSQSADLTGPAHGGYDEFLHGLKDRIRAALPTARRWESSSARPRAMPSPSMPSRP